MIKLFCNIGSVFIVLFIFFKVFFDIIKSYFKNIYYLGILVIYFGLLVSGCF